MESIREAFNYQRKKSGGGKKLYKLHCAAVDLSWKIFRCKF
jgi:hypothetical protein